jgi:hypothetical protein
MSIVSFAVGFVSGWLVRSTVETSRELAVDVAAGSRGAWDRLRRVVIAEREFLEDLWAEATTRSEATSQAEPPLSETREEVNPSSRRERTKVEAEAPS